MIPKLRKTKPADSSQDPVFQEQIGPGQRLLAEAVRLHEDAQGFAINDPQADAIAQNADDDLEHRIIVRARALTIAPALTASLKQLRNAFGLIVVFGVIVAGVIGATTAQVALNSQFEGPVINFFWVLGSLLGVPSIALLVWLILAFLTPRAAAAGSLGNFTFLLGRRISQWLHKGPMQLAAVQAVASVYTRTSIGRWTLSAISHGLWLAFLLGCLLLVLLILSTKQYTFIWETTILSERSYIALTRVIASVPQRLGFLTPDAQQITASQRTDKGEPPAGSRETWSGLLVGSLVAYGLLPRLLLLGFCLLARRRANLQFRLDTELPGYARLQTRLMPASQTIGVVDPDQHGKIREMGKHVYARNAAQPVARAGPAAIMGLEIEQPASAWPPPVRGVDWLDLGFVDSRDDRLRALEQVQSTPFPLRLITIVCSVATTPDRGTRGFISRVRASSDAPVVILLTDGQRLRNRGHRDEVEQRFADWRELAIGAQVSENYIVDMDLDHLTDASRARLAVLMGAGNETASRLRHIEQAFELILDHVGGWPGVPDANAQVEVHRAIAALYSNRRQTWQMLLRTHVETGGDLVGQLKSSANQMLNLLPERLRRNPKWYAAGALAGAMGCVTAATLVSPAAIATLPMWAGLGAALSMIVKLKETEPSPEETPEADLANAVNSAALFAILLELQGRNEVQITRIIDRAAGDNKPPVIKNVAAARQWLNTLRHRFDLALAAENST
jgi:Protein of unknown function (DUF2868)